MYIFDLLGAVTAQFPISTKSYHHIGEETKRVPTNHQMENEMLFSIYNVGEAGQMKERKKEIILP